MQDVKQGIMFERNHSDHVWEMSAGGRGSMEHMWGSEALGEAAGQSRWKRGVAQAREERVG